jgi:hypothetical protein
MFEILKQVNNRKENGRNYLTDTISKIKGYQAYLLSQLRKEVKRQR